MRFCALTLEQHRSLYKLIYKNILESKSFDLKSYAKELYNKVYNGTKNQDLALTYASYVPMYVSNIQTEDKEFRAILKEAKVDANELIDKIDDFDNNLQNVLTFIGVEKVVPVLPTTTASIVEEKVIAPPTPKKAKPLTKVKQGDRVVANGEVMIVQSVKISNDDSPNTYVLEDSDGNTIKQSFKLSDLSEPAPIPKAKTKQEELEATRNLIVEGTQRAETRDEVEEIMKNVFNLNPVEASAVSSIYDRVAQTFARRFNKTVKDFYDTLGFRQSKQEDLTPDTKFQIIGEKGAENLDIKNIRNLVIAEQMEAAGKDYQSIRLATGWERGVDDEWNMEIPDGVIKSIQLNRLKSKSVSGTAYAQLQDIFAQKTDSIYRAYPKLATLTVNFDDSLRAGNAYFNGREITLSMKDIENPEQLRSILIHEIQHYIQNEEGFVGGGNLEIAEELKRDKEIQSLINKTPIKNETAFEYYKKIAGEVQANNAQTRLNLTKEERAITPLQDTESVSREDQILLQQNQGVARAAVTIAEDGKAIVHALTNPNVTSPLHELAHIWEHYLTDKERTTILDWAGNEEWSTATSEKFARGFEKYLAEGDANDINLQMIFDRFAKWLQDIYKGIFGSEIDMQLTDQMRKVYSDMLGSNFQQKTQEELNEELDTRNVVERLIDKYNEDEAKGQDFTEPTSSDSTLFWSHVSVIQRAFINKKYDKLLKEDKINEEKLKQIVISTQHPTEGGLGMDLVTQAVFRVNHPELIEDANYWILTEPEKNSEDYDIYQRTIREVATDGRMLDALNNGIISYIDAGVILKRADYKIATVVEKRIAELKQESEEKGIKKEDIEAKAALERAKILAIKKVVPSVISNEVAIIPKNEVTILEENSPELTTFERDLKNGDKVTANIFGKKVEGTVTGVGIHKNQIVIDFTDTNGDGRFIYANQIENIESGLPQLQNITTEQTERINELISQEELSVENLNELKILTENKDIPTTPVSNAVKESFILADMLQIKRMTKDSKNIYTQALHEATKAKDIPKYTQIMGEIADQLHYSNNSELEEGLHMFIVEKAKEMFPYDASKFETSEQMLERLRLKEESELTDEEVDAMPNKSIESKDIVQGDLVFDGEEETVVEDIIYGENAEDNRYILENGSIAYQDQLTKVYPNQEAYDDQLKEYNSVVSQIFRTTDDEFTGTDANAEQLVPNIVLKTLNKDQEKVPLKEGKKKAAREIGEIIDKAKATGKSNIEALADVRKKGFAFSVKESDTILNYLKDYLVGNTTVPFTEFVDNTNYKSIAEQQKEVEHDFNYLGLKTILERLNAKFRGLVPYEIVKNNESWTGRIKNGVVQINLNKFDKTTPFHEYLHPFIRVLQEDNRVLYNNLIFELKGLKEGFDLIDQVKNLPFYRNSSVNEIEEEALIRYISKKAAENVDNKGRRIEAQYKSKMARLIDRFRDWFDRLWYGGGMILGSNDANITVDKKGKNPLSSFKTMPLDATLEDIADLISLHDLQIDLSERISVVKKMESYQDENAEKVLTDNEKILKRIKEKIPVLEHTARVRQKNDVLVKELIGLRSIIKEADEVTSLSKYMAQAISGMTFAGTTFSAISHKLHAAAGNLTKEDLTTLSSDLQVVKTFIGLYEEAETYFAHGFSKDMDDAEYREYDETFKRMKSIKDQIQHVSINLLTEFLYPEVQKVNEKIKQKYPDRVVTKEAFTNSLYGTAGDIDQAFFLLGSVSSSKDVVSAVVRSALYTIDEENHIYETSVLEDIKIKYSNFLKKIGLKNDRKDTIEYYKKNFLRKVTLTLQKGIDEKKEPIMKDSEHWAFIQEFDYDKYDKDRDAFMKSINYDETNQDHINKLIKWQNDNSQLRDSLQKGKEDILDDKGKKTGTKDVEFTVQISLPSNKYRNAQYDIIKNDPLYQSLTKHYNETNEKLGDAALKYGVIPQVSKGKQLFSDYRDMPMKEKLLVASGKFGNFLLPKNEQETTDFAGKNLDGTVYYGIPNKHVHILEEEDLDLSLPETILKFASDNNLVSLKQSVDPTMQILKDAINGNEKLNIPERKITKVTSDKKTIWDKWTKRPAEVEKRSSLLNKQLTEFVDDTMYGIDSFDANLKVGKRTVSLNKLGNNLGFLTALNNMAFNINGSIGNSTIGNAQLFIESTGGKYFTVKDWAKAEAAYISNTGTFIKDTFDLKKSLITQMGIKYDAIQGEFRDKFGKKFVGDIATRYTNSDTLFILNHIAEHQIQLTGMLSLMNATKVKTNLGQEISLYDAHYINKDGFLRIREDVQWTKQDEIDFTNKWHGINKRLNGNYSSFDKALLQRRWYGRLTLIYRKFIYTNFRARFTKEYTDYELGGVDFGYQRKFFSKLYSDIKLYQLEGAMRFFSKKGWNEDERYAYTKTMTEFGIMAAMSVLVWALAAAESDDEDTSKAEKAILLYAVRFKNDLQMFTVLGVNDMVRILQNPSAIMGTMTKYADFFKQLGTDIGGGEFEKYTRKTGVFEKGEYKLKAKLFKMTPLLRQFINFLSPEEQLAYYNILKDKKN